MSTPYLFPAVAQAFLSRDDYANRAWRKKNTGGTRKAGIMLSTLQSLMFSRLRPEAVISIPPSMLSSVISSGLMADADIFAIM